MVPPGVDEPHPPDYVPGPGGTPHQVLHTISNVPSQKEEDEEDPAYYPADIGDDDEEDEEEEHLAFGHSTHGNLYKIDDKVDERPRHPWSVRISRELDYWTRMSGDEFLETTIMHGLMEDARDDRSELRGRVNLLYRDRPIHHHLAVMVEREAWMAREAWGFSMDVSDDTCSHVLALRTTVVEQRALISGLQAADHQRQVQLTMALKLLKGLQTQMAEFQRQQGPAEGPAQPDAPRAGSCS
ncbi:hypothetical protein Tco_0090050 [Tanacetum coccineum]